MAHQVPPPGGYVVPGPAPPHPQQPMMTQQYIVTIQNTGAGNAGPSTMKVKAIKVTAEIQLCCGVASTALGIAAIKLMCEGYVTGAHIWGGLAFYFVAGVLGMFGALKKSRCLIIAYMVLSIVSSVVAVQQVFMSATFAAIGSRNWQRESCTSLNAVAAAIALMEIISSVVAAAYCCKIVCCGQPSATMIQYVPAVPMGVPQPGMLQGHSVYSPVTCPAGPGEATILSMPVHPPPYHQEGATAPPPPPTAMTTTNTQAEELPKKSSPDRTRPYHTTTGVDGDNPENVSESLLS